MATVYLALGSNLGDRRANLAAAIEGLSRFPWTTVAGTAGIYETDPVGGPEGQGKFLNSAVMIETSLTPRDMLRRIHGLEREIGRLRDGNSVRWGPRLIDIDILFWEGVVMSEADLTIPHPRAAEREFVLIPLADLNPDLILSENGKSVGLLLDELKAKR